MSAILRPTKRAARRFLPRHLRVLISRVQHARNRTTQAYGRIVPEWPTDAPDDPWADTVTTQRFVETPALDDVVGDLASPVVADNLEACRRTGLGTARLLDLGCATGDYCAYLRHFPGTRAWDYVGADINVAVIAHCRQRYPDFQFDVVSPEGQLPYADDEFDVAFVSGTLQYTNDWQGRLKDLKRIARRSVVLGRLPLWRRHPSAIALQIVQHSGGEEQHPVHLWNRAALESTLRDLGFGIEFCKPGFERLRVVDVAEQVVYHTYLLRRA